MRSSALLWGRHIQHGAEWCPQPTDEVLPCSTDRAETNFFTGDPLRSLTTLSYSENVDLQRSAALAFAEITEK